MTRAVPVYARELFCWLETVGWPQKRCAAALGVSIQACNNWASGRNNVPVRYRQPIMQLVEAAMVQALTAAEAQPPPALAQCREQCMQAVFRWYFEVQEKGGVSDQWHAEVGQRLAIAFKTPLSEQGVAAWHAELALHLEAANMLRRLLRLHDPASAPTQLEDTYRGFEDPLAMFKAIAAWAVGERPETDEDAGEQP